MYLRGIFKAGGCEVNGYTVNSGVKIKNNDFVEIEVDLDRETAMRPEAVALDIVHEEAEFLIVNKPPEMLVHPTHRDKNGTILNALAYYLNEECGVRSAEYPNGDQLKDKTDFAAAATDINHSALRTSHSAFIRPGLIHRLDKKTSGLLLIAKTARAHRILSDQFERKTVEKKYAALVEGSVEKDAGEIIAPIGRFEETKHWNIKADGKYAETRFQVRERFADTTLLELQPITGRTNQLRIHCEHLGHPIVGDEKRGGREFARLCLHAFKLSFNHPTTHQEITFEINLPADFTRDSYNLPSNTRNFAPKTRVI